MIYDVIVIGAGHNGLVTAALLARAGKKVLVLEKRAVVGGIAATEEIFPGFKFNISPYDAGLFLPELVKKLNLQNYGLEFLESPVAAVATNAVDHPLILWRDVEKNVKEIARFSQRDSVKFTLFHRFMQKAANVLRPTLTLTPPNLKDKNYSEFYPWLRPAMKLKRLGKHDMMELLRILPMPVMEFLDEWFESDLLKGLLGSSGVLGSMQGPMASGTTFVMLYHYLGVPNGGFRSSRAVKGGIGQLSMALAEVAQRHGAEIRTACGVQGVIIKDSMAKGVVLENGDEHPSHKVISALDPRRTFFQLVGGPNLGPHFIRKVKNIRFRGTTAKFNLALDSLPQFNNISDPELLSGHIIICPSLQYLERAYDDAKYGKISQEPYLDINIPTILDPTLAPKGKHIMNVTMQYAPYHLRKGHWGTERDNLRKIIVNTLKKHIKNIEDLILHEQLITPLDWEEQYGLTEGSIFHGQMGLDQLLFMRPVPGWGHYRTPIENLYLCGSGTHPGGGITGAPGFNAAREVLKGWK